MSWKNEVTIEQVVNMLNELIGLDAGAVHALINHRVPCNDLLAHHPTVQVRQLEDGTFAVGILGFINGLFGVNEGGFGPIMIVLDDSKEENDASSILYAIRTQDLTSEGNRTEVQNE